MSRVALYVTAAGGRRLAIDGAGDSSAVSAGQAPTVLVVWDTPPADFRTNIPVARRILLETEPPDMRRYPAGYRRQFGLVVTPDRAIDHANVRFDYTGLGWWVRRPLDTGERSADPALLRNWDPPKSRLISVVSSGKRRLPGHRARLNFVDQLKTAFGDEIDVFGRGINDFAFKEDVLADYRFHIAIENSAIPYYWTEKLADPLMTLTYPIYHGCSNIGDYLPAGALTSIDIGAPERAIATIRQLIATAADRTAHAAMIAARDRLLDDYSVEAIVRRFAGDVAGAEPLPRAVRLYPPESFAPLPERLDRVWFSVRRWSRRFRGRQRH